MVAEVVRLHFLARGCLVYLPHRFNDFSIDGLDHGSDSLRSLQRCHLLEGLLEVIGVIHRGRLLVVQGQWRARLVRLWAAFGVDALDVHILIVFDEVAVGAVVVYVLVSNHFCTGHG